MRSILLLTLALAQAAAQPARVSGPWHGAIAIQGISLNIVVTFDEKDGALTGTIDIPQQGAKGLPLREISQEGTAIRFALPVGVKATFDGQLAGDEIAGTFTQGAAAGKFSLTRGPVPAVPAGPPPPYRERPFTVTNGDVMLRGTLSTPEGDGPFPAVVLVTGSGAQTRDEDIMGFKVFATIADHLTRKGIAVYRYDDRGVGESTGSIARSTTADFADDALAAVEALNKTAGIDGTRIGILGHSEGAVAAAIAAAKSPAVAFIVMLAGPGLPGGLVMRRQAADGAKALGANEDQVAAIVEAHKALMEAIASGASPEAMAAAVRTLIARQFDGLPAAQRAQLGDRDAYVEKTYRPHVLSSSTPWMKFLVTFDPATALRQVTVPVYAAFGEKDTQVPPALNESPVRAALAANRGATVKVYPDANHLFQKARTGQVAEYGVLDKAFVTGLLDDVSAWILAGANR